MCIGRPKEEVASTPSSFSEHFCRLGLGVRRYSAAKIKRRVILQTRHDSDCTRSRTPRDVGREWGCCAIVWNPRQGTGSLPRHERAQGWRRGFDPHASRASAGFIPRGERMQETAPRSVHSLSVVSVYCTGTIRLIALSHPQWVSPAKYPNWPSRGLELWACSFCKVFQSSGFVAKQTDCTPAVEITTVLRAAIASE